MTVLTNIDRAIDGLQRISLMAQLRDKVSIALAAGKPRCGNCYYWMKSRDCPHEHNVGGMSRGPSADALTCSKFKITQRAVDLRAKRIREAVEFANRYGLPIPTFLAAGGSNGQ